MTARHGLSGLEPHKVLECTEIKSEMVIVYVD
jgi:hypothetical protein